MFGYLIGFIYMWRMALVVTGGCTTLQHTSSSPPPVPGRNGPALRKQVALNPRCTTHPLVLADSVVFRLSGACLRRMLPASPARQAALLFMVQAPATA